MDRGSQQDSSPIPKKSTSKKNLKKSAGPLESAGPVAQWRSYRGAGGGGPGSGKWKIRKFAIWGKMTPNYSAVLDFDYQLRRHGLLPSNNYSQSPTKQLNKSGST